MGTGITRAFRAHSKDFLEFRHLSFRPAIKALEGQRSIRYFHCVVICCAILFYSHKRRHVQEPSFRGCKRPTRRKRASTKREPNAFGKRKKNCVRTGGTASKASGLRHVGVWIDDPSVGWLLLSWHFRFAWLVATLRTRGTLPFGAIPVPPLSPAIENRSKRLRNGNEYSLKIY